MSSFKCEKCGMDIIDSENGYVTECEHHPSFLLERLTVFMHDTDAVKCYIGEDRYGYTLNGYQEFKLNRHTDRVEYVGFILTQVRIQDIDIQIPGDYSFLNLDANILIDVVQSEVKKYIKILEKKRRALEKQIIKQVTTALTITANGETKGKNND